MNQANGEPEKIVCRHSPMIPIEFRDDKGELLGEVKVDLWVHLQDITEIEEPYQGRLLDSMYYEQIRRLIKTKYGLEISQIAAQDFANGVKEVANELEKKDLPTAGSPTTTGSTPESGAPSSVTAGTETSSDSTPTSD